MAARDIARELPPLYDPRFEHDACGVGFVVDMQGRKSHAHRRRRRSRRCAA